MRSVLCGMAVLLVCGVGTGQGGLIANFEMPAYSRGFLEGQAGWTAGVLEPTYGLAHVVNADTGYTSMDPLSGSQSAYFAWGYAKKTIDAYANPFVVSWHVMVDPDAVTAVALGYGAANPRYAVALYGATGLVKYYTENEGYVVIPGLTVTMYEHSVFGFEVDTLHAKFRVFKMVGGSPVYSDPINMNFGTTLNSITITVWQGGAIYDEVESHEIPDVGTVVVVR